MQNDEKKQHKCHTTNGFIKKRMEPMLKGLFLLDEAAYHKIYGEAEREHIGKLVQIDAPLQTSQTIASNPAVLADIDFIFSGWGCPRFTQELLAHAPRLKAVFYGAGSIHYFVTDAFWERGVIVTTAYEANDIPVAQFALAQILLSLKGYWRYVQRFKQGVAWWDHLPSVGIYGGTVGLISLGMIGRMVAEHLKRFDVHVLAYDPFATQETAQKYNVALCGLEELFTRSNVVSLHTPWLPETERMITGRHFASMKTGACFINTARGAIVREDEMAAVLKERPDLFALLDVTYPEPPAPDSPLLQLPNVIITPHMAGAENAECKRNGQWMVAELKRYLNGEPLRFAVSREQAALMA
jgi:phosphoglycerate dehydrogenase-like enzyme